MLLKDLQTLATKLATGTLFHVEKAGKAYSVDYSALAKAIIEEYADSTVGGSKQSVQAAIGALNSRTNVNVMYSDSEMSALGGAEATIADAISKQKFPVSIPFCGMMQVGSRYYIDGYIYPGYQYGSLWMHRFDDYALFVSIKGGSVSVKKLPTRSEFTALEERVAALES